jgi:hypothetical protein
MAEKYCCDDLFAAFKIQIELIKYSTVPKCGSFMLAKRESLEFGAAAVSKSSLGLPPTLV